jgi:hypothetical protein
MSSAAAPAPTRLEVERLSSLGERFRVWQVRQGKSCFKMPSCLWDEAFAFVPLFGARRVAREIGMSREDLLRRINEEQESVVAAAPASVPPDHEFLEVEMEWPGVAMPPPTPRSTVTEVPAPAPPVTREPERSAPAPAVAANVASTTDTAPLRAEEAWLEVVAPDGAKLTLRIPVSHLMNASALVREFRSQR